MEGFYISKRKESIVRGQVPLFGGKDQQGFIMQVT